MLLSLMRYGYAAPTGARSGTKCEEGNGCCSEKSTRLKEGGRVGSESTDFDFLLNNLSQSVLSLLYNPRPPVRGLASLKGSTLSVRNVIRELKQRDDDAENNA